MVLHPQESVFLFRKPYNLDYNTEHPEMDGQFQAIPH